MKKIKWLKSNGSQNNGNVIKLSIHSGGENRKNFACAFHMDVSLISKTGYVDFGTYGNRIYLREACGVMDGVKISSKKKPFVAKCSSNHIVAWLIGREGSYSLQYDEEEKLYYAEVNSERS